MSRALEALEGVKKTAVSFREKKAVVYFEDESVSVDEMIRAVTQAGFQAARETSEPRR